MKVSVLTYTKGVDDPKQVILNAVKEHVDRGIRNLFGNRVLVATAPHATVSKGGIIFADKTKDEERYQGTVGLVLAMGPTAFMYEDDQGKYSFDGERPSVGDWVWYRNADTWECGINEASCRIVKDNMIIGVLNDPEVVW
jgi:co-chaperonin GroES (HSP10)